MYKKGQIKLSDVGRCLGRFSRPLYQSQNLHTVADVRYCREKTHLLNSVVVLLSEVMANWFQVWSREEFTPKTQLFVREHFSLRISRTGLSKYRQHNKTFLHLHFPRKKKRLRPRLKKLPLILKTSCKDVECQSIFIRN